MAGKSNKRWCAAWLPLLLALGACDRHPSAATPPAAQTQTLTQTPGTTGRGHQSFYYGAPHQTQRKMEISWDRDQPLPTGGNVLFNGLKLDTFQETGEPGLTMEAPECVFNNTALTGSSSGPLKVRTADGNSFIEGTGYLWSFKDTNLTVTISNNVATTLKREFLTTGTNLTAQSASTADQFVHIHADSVFMDRAASLVTYTGHVHAEDERLDLTCETLKIRGATNGTTSENASVAAGGKISEMIADRNVVIIDKADGGRATGERAVYSLVDGQQVVTLTGDPHWQAGLREATARAFVFERAANTLSAVGDAHYKLPSDSIGKSGFTMLPQSGGGTGGTAVSTNLMDFYAGIITLQLPATNSGPLRGVIAETNVVILDPGDDREASGQRLVYTQTNGAAELTGKASWRQGRRIARGERLAFNQKDNTFSARTNAYLQFPAGELRQTAAFSGLPAAGKGRTTNQLVAVSADSYDYQNETLTFHDRVRGAISEDDVVRGTLESDVLAVNFLNTNVVREIDAEGGVHLHQLPALDAKGSLVEGDFKSDRLQIRMRTNQIPVQTNVLLEQITATGGVMATRTVISTNKTTIQPVPAAGGATAASRPQTNHVTFSADRLTASFQPDTNQVEIVIGEGRVVMAQNDYTARGTKVVYTATNDTVVLTGNPRLETTNGWQAADDTIVYDHAHGIIQATHHNHLVFDLPDRTLDKMKTPAMMRTNTK